MCGLVAVMTMGCADSTKTKEQKKPVGNADATDDHGHDHVHGPMGGEVFDVAGMEMKIEVSAKYGQNLVIVAFYESDIKTAKKVKCEKLIGRIPANPDKEFEFEPIDTEDGMSGKFEIENQDLAIARKTVGFVLEFEIDGKKHTIEIPKDPHG